MNFWVKYILLRIFRPYGRMTQEYRLFRYLNKARKEHGLWQLFFQNDLRAVARRHSKDMAKHDYFAHEGRSGTSPKDRFEQLNISEVIAGENLAKIRGHRDPVLTAHIGLMNSPGHKANILSKSYNCVGIGLAVSKDKTYYYTQNFSHRSFLVKGVKSRVWFAKQLKLAVVRIDKSHDGLIVIVKDQFSTEISRNEYSFESKKLNIKVDLLKGAKKYSVEIYSKTSLKLVNKFDVQKML